MCSLIKPEKYSGKRRGACTSEISTIGSENQVKTYMDSSNGVRNASSNAYNKVRASATLLELIFQLKKKKSSHHKNKIEKKKNKKNMIKDIIKIKIPSMEHNYP